MKVIKSTLVLLLVMILSSGAEAQDIPLEIKITSEKTTFLLGEPIIVRVTLTNRGRSPLKIIPLLDPAYHFVRFTILTPAGDTTQFSPVFYKEKVVEAVSLAAGQSRSEDAPLYYGSQGYTFGTSGTYFITGTYAGISSKPIAIVVDSAETADERAAADMMLRDKVGLFILVGGAESLKTELSDLKKLQETYPRTILAAYASYALGIYYSRSGRNFEANKVRKPSLDQSTSYLIQSLQIPLPSHFRIHEYSQIVYNLIEAKKMDEARRYLSDFENQYGDHPTARPMFEGIRRAMQIE